MEQRENAAGEGPEAYGAALLETEDDVPRKRPTDEVPVHGITRPSGGEKGKDKPGKGDAWGVAPREWKRKTYKSGERRRHAQRSDIKDSLLTGSGWERLILP